MLIGLVGAPSAGKSTFFKAATLSDVEIASYPFTTISPNRGAAFVKINCVDKEFNKQCNPREGFCINHKRFVPVELMDVAGLVPGAHKGLGMGNQFLNDLNQADVLIHVVDISGKTNTKGEAVENHNPLENIRFLEDEINFWFHGLISKNWDKFARTAKQEKQELYKALFKQLSGLKVTEEIAKEAIKSFNPDPTQWSEGDVLALAKKLRQLTKPIIIAANKFDSPGSFENYEKAKQEFKESIIIPCSAESELALREATKKDLIDYIPGENDFIIKKDLTEQQKKGLEFIKENILNKLGNTGIQETLNKEVFDVLKYIAVFPGGVGKMEDSHGRVLADCFLLPKGTTALDFAYKLHTDIGKKFIKAIDVKTRQIIAKDYQLKHRDVIEIKTNA